MRPGGICISDTIGQRTTIGLFFVDGGMREAVRAISKGVMGSAITRGMSRTFTALSRKGAVP